MTGRVEQGVVKVGEEVEVVGLRTVWKTILISFIAIHFRRFSLSHSYNMLMGFLSLHVPQGPNLKTTVTGVEMFKKQLDQGQVLLFCQPDSIMFFSVRWTSSDLLTRSVRWVSLEFFRFLSLVSF